MIEFLLLLAALAIPAFLGHLLRLVRPQWTARRISYIAASPIPLLIAVACVFIIVEASMTPSEKCGVDACGMAMAMSVITLVIAFALFVIGAIIVPLWLRHTEKP